MKFAFSAISILLVALLTGCGGSSSTNSASGSSAQPVAITTSNQSSITSTAIASATQSLAGSNLSLIGVQTSSTSAGNERVMTDLANMAFDQLIKNENTPLSVTGASATVSCDSSGANNSAYGTINASTDGSSTTPYTYFTISFNNCVLSGTPTSGVVFNGSLSMNNMKVTRNATTNAITDITATFDFNLSMTDKTTATTHTGSINSGFTIAATGIKTATRTDSITGTKYNVSYDALWVSLSNFSFTSKYDDTTLSHGYTDTVNYTYASDVIQAGFTFTTINSLVRNAGDTRPRDGQVVISGANSTKLRVTVLPYNATTNPNAGSTLGKLTLELDQGTGTYGTAVTKTWATL